MERELKERKWKGNMRGRQAVLIPGIFFWGGGIAKTYNSPHCCQIAFSKSFLAGTRNYKYITETSF